MKESEKAGNNINAREIIQKVLEEVGMNGPSFAAAIGISYMRVFDLQRGRTKKFNPGVVNAVCKAFPQISKSFLYTGEGPVSNSQYVTTVEKKHHEVVQAATAASEMQMKILELHQQLLMKEKDIAEREDKLREREDKLREREDKLREREEAVQRREIEPGRREFAAVSPHSYAVQQNRDITV